MLGLPSRPAVVSVNPRQRALDLLSLVDPFAKAALTRELAAAAGSLAEHHTAEVFEPADPLPGRPALPRLVPPKEVPARSPFTPDGRAALLHAVTHIEFNAINLALDAVWRFADMPLAFYRDWLQVAGEEVNRPGFRGGPLG